MKKKPQENKIRDEKKRKMKMRRERETRTAGSTLFIRRLIYNEIKHE